MAQLKRFLDLGWNPELHPVGLMRKVRTLATVAVIVVLVCIPFLLRAIEWQIGLRLLTIPFAVFTAISAVYVLSRVHSERAFYWASHWLCIGVLSLIVGALLTGGGTSSASQGALVVLPLIAGVTAGRREAMAWGVVALLVTLLIGMLEYYGVEFPNLTPLPFRHSQSLLHAIGITLAVLGILSGFFHQLSHSENLLEEKNRDLQAQIQHTHQALEKAQSAERAKVRFLANMSHEMRTPLNAIVGFPRQLERSLKGRLSEREADSLHEIQRSGKEMLQLVEDLFDLSALESADLKLDAGPVDLQQLLESISRSQDDPLLQNRVKLILETPTALLLLADARRIKQALLTLLRFCSKIGKGNVVELLAMAHRDDTVEIRLQVAGKPAQDGWQERLFDRYNHLHSWQESEGGVSGLGMALASELIQAQGGSVICQTLDQGIRLVVRMPVFTWVQTAASPHSPTPTGHATSR